MIFLGVAALQDLCKMHQVRNRSLRRASCPMLSRERMVHDVESRLVDSIMKIDLVDEGDARLTGVVVLQGVYTEALGLFDEQRRKHINKKSSCCTSTTIHSSASTDTLAISINSTYPTYARSAFFKNMFRIQQRQQTADMFFSTSNKSAASSIKTKSTPKISTRQVKDSSSPSTRNNSVDFQTAGEKQASRRANRFNPECLVLLATMK